MVNFKEIQKNYIYKNLFDGHWVESNSGDNIEIKSPIDENTLGYVQAMTKEEANKSIENACEAQRYWKQVPINKRADILHRAASILEENAEEIAEILTMEIAKDKKSSLAEITRTADYIRFSADAGKQLEGETIPGDSFPGTEKNKISVVTREPLGVVLAISPFNYPINLSASKIAPALIAGNSVILKPPTQGSISALYLAEVFNKAGLPRGVLNTITGKGKDIGDYVVTHPKIDFINFTGSTEVGQHISKITTMKPLLLELGGKDAAIVLEDADLDESAKNIVNGAYSYSGQRCTAVKRILVMEKVADELSTKIKNLVEKLSVGDPRENSVIGPLINDKAADFVMNLIEDAEGKGAKLLAGGKREGRLIYPTLFDHVNLDMKIAWEEPFGPVLPIIRIKSIDEAIKIANESKYGLQSSIFTKNIEAAFYIADKLEVGTVQINNKTERGPDHFPFSGVKSSGMGTQGIKYSIEAMSRLKAIVLNLKKEI
ncbi:MULTISPECIES: NADP-dependent glyceraldehyde-3-phosphate dehydrogenase [Clostridium]|uniref:NADP-dependent glyceraldehyde-3-phosphate dehydrogenase n=1 Tax=Clostridium cadaveris TaxID=1529 RepID=A0A316M0X4_9CLOT|nr:NADP-dependent glyceraldehyde-3-phosphate dehydrogenase [Clostridium cadaveris]MDU4951117.1 NADP-dependent glyceraldehyde-3-phosphate dehydrogenase [Clostridium sp.]NWK10054.1 NADP-dependent glyceraldehyde-3-phosphate dehydrogenase [Clostridium cadaveris]PWL52252.1 MAG: NADP-dependent glyceraldehyde-3-phosphate dehydrogenase [Clostridium cadaveris]